MMTAGLGKNQTKNQSETRPPANLSFSQRLQKLYRPLMATHGLEGSVCSHELEREVGQIMHDCSNPSALGAGLGRVAELIDDTTNRPDTTHDPGRAGELKAGNEQRAEERRQVLGEIGVRTLGAVEGEGVPVLGSDLVGRVRGRIRHLCPLPPFGSRAAQVSVHEEGGRGGGEHPAIFFRDRYSHVER